MGSIQDSKNRSLKLTNNVTEAENGGKTIKVCFQVSPEERKLIGYRFLDQIMQSIDEKKSEQKERESKDKSSMRKNPKSKLVTTLPSFKPLVTTVLQTAPFELEDKPGIIGQAIATGEDINHLMVLKKYQKTPLIPRSKSSRSKKRKNGKRKNGGFIQGDCSGDKLVMGDVEGKTTRLSREEIRALRSRKDDSRSKVEVNESKMAEAGEVTLCYKIEAVSVGSIVKSWLSDKVKSVRRFFTLD